MSRLQIQDVKYICDRVLRIKWVDGCIDEVDFSDIMMGDFENSLTRGYPGSVYPVQVFQEATMDIKDKKLTDKHIILGNGVKVGPWAIRDALYRKHWHGISSNEKLDSIIENTDISEVSEKKALSDARRAYYSLGLMPALIDALLVCQKNKIPLPDWLFKALSNHLIDTLEKSKNTDGGEGQRFERFWRDYSRWYVSDYMKRQRKLNDLSPFKNEKLKDLKGDSHSLSGKMLGDSAATIKEADFKMRKIWDLDLGESEYHPNKAIVLSILGDGLPSELGLNYMGVGNFQESQGGRNRKEKLLDKARKRLGPK